MSELQQRHPEQRHHPEADYGRLLAEVKGRVRAAQYAALKAVNTALVGLYWKIGQMIVERQRDAEQGAAIAEQLAGDFQREFPGVGGFSVSSLWRMKAFYETYAALEKLAPLVREISWSGPQPPGESWISIIQIDINRIMLGGRGNTRYGTIDLFSIRGLA